jgi:hypothetical protein
MTITEIYFFGLIAHIGNPVEATHGAIVWGIKHPHQASVYFAQDGSTTTVNKGDDIYLGAPPYASGPKSQDFDHFVPALQWLSTPTSVKAGVLNHNDHSDVTSFIRYPASNNGLAVADRYSDGALFLRAGGFRWEQCVARLTVTQVNTDQPLPVTIGAPPSKLVDAGSWILIMNLGKTRAGANHNHFEEYKHLTGAQLLALPNKIARDCAFVNKKLVHIAAVRSYIASLHPEAADEIECSNSKWP